jgi:hypothetical protein
LILFRLAQTEDAEEIMHFLKTNYNESHILANDREFLLYEHLWGSRLNFLLACDIHNNTIQGLVGFHQYSSSESDCHISSTMLCVNKDCRAPFLGLKLLQELKHRLKIKSYCGVTTNELTVSPYVSRFLKHFVGEFSHLYIPNPDINNFRILGQHSRHFNRSESIFIEPNLKEFKTVDHLYGMNCLNRSHSNLPFKSIDFLLRRYFLNPIFKYRFFIWFEKKTDALVILKQENVFKTSVLRVVDFIGDIDLLNDISFQLLKLVRNEGHEYCDLFCSSLNFANSRSNCFLNKAKTGAIVPHYFNPYVQSNISVLFETDSPHLVYFKGHGDGDRANYRIAH